MRTQNTYETLIPKHITESYKGEEQFVANSTCNLARNTTWKERNFPPKEQGAPSGGRLMSIVPHRNRNRGRVLPPHSHHLFPPGAAVLWSEAEKAQPSPGV
ncbi:hypothetical protein TNIN_180591 [Trichonephila inaurata madagascariensis]|uniref:Uncharacterized protein n=1 Tax=Trichonephila inaurata madagascariensis TaxID=2747483 RepID=A0A8X6X4I4_9ARAC|nr:hypothetical protein TNIN_180591 [Trichonephila inaurata madagascariensis]